jgi:hypothetical protein
MEVPLNIVYSTGNNKGGFFIGAGPSLNIGFSGKYTATITGAGVSRTENYDIKFDGTKNANDNKGHLKPFELGLNVLAGYRFTDKLFIHANYNAGLSNIGVEDKEKFKNSYIGLGLGYTLTQ